MRRCRMRSMWHSMRGALAEWRWEKRRPRNCRNATPFANIEMNSWPRPEWKRPCSSATAKARFVIELCPTKNCVPVFKGNDVSRSIQFPRDNKKYCRVARAYADGGVVHLVADPFHSTVGNFNRPECGPGAIHVGGSRSRPWRSGFRSDVRRNL